MEHFANLGTAAVLDASKLRCGDKIEIGGQVLVVANIVDDLHVYFRPVSTLDAWRFRWTRFSWGEKLVVLAIVTALLGILCYAGYVII